MKKISINMLSSATKIKGQGVGSAYLELVDLLSNNLSDLFEIKINSMSSCDINHYHTIDPTHYIKLISSRKNNNIVYVHFLPHTLDGSIKIPELLFSFFKDYLIKFYQKADYLIVVNPIFIDEITRYNIPREKIHYIPNYVSPNNFYKLSTDIIDNLKDEYNIDKNKFCVIGVGQVQTRKGVKDFVETALQIPDAQFIWVGGFSFGKITDGFKELDEIVKNPPSNVRFVGIIDRVKMNGLYNAADILFMPSYNELFPIAILENINLEKPLVVRNLDLYEPILFKKYYSGENVLDFTDIIKRLKNDKQYYEQGCENSKYLKNYYSKENIIKIWKEFYMMVNSNVIKYKRKKNIHE